MGAPQVRSPSSSASVNCTCSRATLLTQRPDTIQQSSWPSDPFSGMLARLTADSWCLCRVPLPSGHAADLAASHIQRRPVHEMASAAGRQSSAFADEPHCSAAEALEVLHASAAICRKAARGCILLSLWPSEAVVLPCCSNMVENEESANGYRLAGKADVRLVTPASEAATRRKGGTTGNRGGKRRRVRGTYSMPGTATVTCQQPAVW